MLSFWTGFHKATFSSIGLAGFAAGFVAAPMGALMSLEGIGWAAWLILALAVPFLIAFCEGMDHGSMFDRNVPASISLAAAYTVSLTIFALGTYVVLPMLQMKADSVLNTLPLER